MTTTFTPDIIHSYAKLQNFLVGPEADARLCQRLQETEQPVTSCRSPCYAVFLVSIGSLLQLMGFVKQGLALEARGAAIKQNHQSWGKFGKDCVARSINKYSEETVNTLYPLGNILPATIADPNVRALIRRDVLDFQDPTGICLGECRWFVRTYLKTKTFFQSHRQHLEAIGKLFRHGAPIEAAIIQKVWPEDKFLQFRTTEKMVLSNYQSSKKPLSPEMIAEVATTFKNLDPGAYYLGVPVHGLAYIQIGLGEGYLYDPNQGTAFIHDDKGFRKLAHSIAHYQKYREEHVAQASTRSKETARTLLVKIHKIELTNPDQSPSS